MMALKDVDTGEVFKPTILIFTKNLTRMGRAGQGGEGVRGRVRKRGVVQVPQEVDRRDRALAHG